MMKMVFALLVTTGFQAFASSDDWPSQVVTCQREETGTKFVMEIFKKDRGSKVKKNKLISLRIGDYYFDEGPLECEDAFRSGGNSGDYCDLGYGQTVHLFPNNYTPHSGVTLYENMRSVSEDTGLECDF